MGIWEYIGDNFLNTFPSSPWRLGIFFRSLNQRKISEGEVGSLLAKRRKRKVRTSLKTDE
jgi:hypothetical protein